MFNYDKLIFGFKKRIQVQLTFDSLSQKKLIIIILVGGVLLFIVGGLIVLKPWKTKTPVSTQKPAKQIPKHTQATPQTNPFEVKVNPFRDIKANPFR